MAGVLLAALVTTLIAVRLFQQWAHDQTVTELRQEAPDQDAALLDLWRERVGLLDALVDVHVSHASNVGL